jgi:hypothetical protein
MTRCESLEWVMKSAVGHGLVTDQFLTFERKSWKSNNPVSDGVFFGGRYRI